MAEKRKYKAYKKYQVVYADLGYRGPGVQGMLRPCIIVSRNESNHAYAPQVTICPLSSKLKNKKPHVQIPKNAVNGYHLRTVSDLLPEDMQTIHKSDIRGTIGFVTVESNVQEAIDKALILQLDLLETARKIIEEERQDAETKEG